MSGTMVIAPAASPDGAMYFGKNSNRTAGECQIVITLPAVQRDSNTLLKCTHLTIPQTPRRNGVILSQPWWAWGGEMGANDHGVVVGCEAVNTRDHEPEPGLTGMDLVRLGLERGNSAEDILSIITSLLQIHGQGELYRIGNYYYGLDSSFIIADANTAWILETAGRHWVARKIRNQAVLSSELTIRKDFDRNSYAMPQYARRKGWTRREEDIDFAATFGRRLLRAFRGTRQRRAILQDGLARINRDLPQLSIMRLLRSRKASHTRSQSKSDVALHASGRTHPIQTTGSMVACVSKRRQDFYFTGTSAPDLSIFKPVHFNLPLENELQGEDLSSYHEGSLWWRHEKLHRAMLLAPHPDTDFTKERDELEQSLLLDLAKLKGQELVETRKRLRDDLLKWEESWIEKAASMKKARLLISTSARFWRRCNRLDGIEL